MSEFKLISNYRDHTGYRHSFNQLAHDVFGIDFERWYQLGLWNDSYIPYSYLDGDRVVANVSVSKLEMVLAGERKSALQIGTVMTHPDYRRRGLAAGLMKTVLAEYGQSFEIIYLFPEDSAIEFYRKFGFAQYQEGKFSLELSQSRSNAGNVRKLDIANPGDRKLFVDCIQNRVSLSRIFGVDRAESIVAWYAVGVMQNVVYYLPTADAIVFYKQSNNKLQVYDVITKERVSFASILEQLPFADVEKVVFHFTPDFADVDTSRLTFQPEEILFVKPESLKIAEPFAYPITAHA